jgi:hypothetical protein
MGHFCRICGRIRANERFSGKGRRDHVCQDCARLPRAVREKIDLLEELSGMLHQSHISPKNQTRLQSLIAHPDSEIARAATVLLELARKYPYRRRRLVRLRRKRDFVHRLMTELPPGMWEDYVNRFGDFLEDPYELLPGFGTIAESLPPASDGVATSSLPFETLCQGDEDIATPLLFSMGAVSNFAPEDPGPDPEPDEPICWEACEPIQPPFGDW